MNYYISAKKMFYTVIFACLLGIDAVVGSQSEYIFQFTNNLVGIIFALVMFTAYDPKEFLRPFYIFWSVFGIVITAFGALFWMNHQEGHMLALWIAVPLNIWILGTVCFKLLEKIFISGEVKIKISKIECLFMAGLLLMTLSLNEAIWPAYYMVIFVTLRHTPFSEKDKKELYEGFLNGIIVGAVFVQCFAFYNRPYDKVRYNGSYGDCNRNACMYMVTTIALLSKALLYNKINRVKSILFFAFGSIFFTFLLFTGCRSAFIGMILAVPVFLIADWKLINENLIFLLLKFVCWIVFSVFLIPFVYALIRYIPAVCDHPLYYNEWTELRVQPRSSIDDERYISIDQSLEMMADRFLFKEEVGGVLYNLLNNDFANPFVMKVFAADPNLFIDSPYYTIVYNSYDDPEEPMEALEIPKFLFTNKATIDVRICIVAVLLKHANMLGHSSSSGRYYISIWTDYSKYNVVSHNPQNFIIYMLYSHGLIFGLFGIMLYFAGLVMVLRSAFRGNVRSVVALMFYMIHLGMGITEIVWIPGQIVLVALFFMVTSELDSKAVNTCH